MTRCWIQRGLWSGILAMTCGVAAQTALAQEPPADEPQAEPTSRPALKPQTEEQAEAMERLLRLRDEMQKQEEARQQAGEQEPATPAPERPGARRPPAAPARTPATSPRIAATSQPAVLGDTHPEIPDDFVGPPSYLAPETPAGSESRTLSPAELRERAARERGEQGDAEAEPAETETETEPLVRRPKDDLNEQTEWFNFRDTPWEDVVQVFIDRIGKPLMGEPPIIGGTLTYVTDRKFTKDEALDELNLLMHEQGYRFVEQEHHVRVIMVSEMQWWVPITQIFASVEEFEAANPRNMDYVVVYYQAGDKPAKSLMDAFQDALPDGTLMTELADTNQIKITALARDVRRFLMLKDKIDLKPNDPRQIRFFDIKTNARDIEQLLRDFMKLGSRTPQIQMVRDPRTNRMVPQRVDAGGSENDNVQIVADDRTNSIIVKATEDKLEEIAKLIKQFDQKPEIGEFETTVVEVKHADATEVANLLNQIFQQEQGQSQTPAWQLQRIRQMQQVQQQQNRGQRTTRVQTPQAQGPAPEDILAEGIFERAKKTVRLVADSRLNVLIVYANADGLARVRKTLDLIDQPQPDKLQTIPLENATLADIAPMVQQIVASSTEGGRGVTLVPDETANAFHIIAERDDMEKITSLIKQLDVPAPEKERHVLQLKKLTPSQVASMIQSLLSEGAGARTTATSVRNRINRGVRGATPMSPSVAQAQTYQLIPLDEAQILIVYCSEEDWARIDETVQLWEDNALTSTPELESFTIQNGNAASIAEKLNMMYRSYQHPILGRASVAVEAEGDKLWVYGVRPAIDEIASLIETLDVEGPEDRVEILPLQYADASTVAQQLQVVLGISQRGRGGAIGPVIQAEVLTNSLIVQAEKDDLEKIKDYALRMDQEVSAQQPERKFFTPRYADAREVATAVQQLYALSQRGRAPTGSAIKAFASGTQVIVEAPKDKLAEIETFISQLDDPQGRAIVIKPIKLEGGADVAAIAGKLNNAFRTKPNTTARFDPDAASETIVVTCTRDELPEVEALIAEFVEVGKRVGQVVEFRQMTYAQAPEAANWLRDTLITYVQTNLGHNAASQIRVVADPRTNRIVINGPKFAVEYAKVLMDQYDVEVAQPPAAVVQNEVRKLPGLDVSGLANALTVTFRNQPRRTDGLNATFVADPTTETLIVSAPKDMFEEINRIITQFETEAEGVVPEQVFVQVVNADAAYLVNQVRSVLLTKVTQTRGRGVAERISITPETRLNQIIINAPKFIIPMAQELIAKLDQPPTGQGQLQTIPLANADVNNVFSVVRQIFDEKIRARTLQVSAEPLTNSLIVGGAKEDVEQIRKWATDLDEALLTQGQVPQIVSLVYADANEVANMINQWFGPRRGEGESQRAKATVVNGTLVVSAPKGKFDEIKELIGEVDQQDRTAVQIKTYDLKVLNATVVQVAVQNFLRDMGTTSTRRGQLKPGAFAEPTTNTLVVLAAPDIFPWIDDLIATLEGKAPQAGQMQAYVLANVRAEQVTGNVDAMLKAKVMEREGAKKSIIQTAVFAEPVTNRLFVYAPEEYQNLAGELIKLIDQEVQSTDIVHIITLENADAAQMAQTLQQTIASAGRQVGSPAARSGTATVRITADAGSNSLILSGMPKDVAEVENWIGDLEEKGNLIPELQIFQLTYATTGEVLDPLEKLTTSAGGRGRNMQDAVTITPDEYKNQLIVTANRRKMRQVEEWIKQLDRAPELTEAGALPGGRQVYFVDINRGSAYNIVWDVEAALEDVLPPEDRGGPSIESDWFDEYLIVRCRPSEFPTIENLIRQFESRYKPEIVHRVYKPKGDTDTLLQYLIARGEDVNVIRAADKPVREGLVEPLWKEGEEPDAVKAKREREKPRGGGVAPVGAGLSRAPAPSNGWFRFASDEPPPAPGRVPPPSPTVPAPRPAASAGAPTSRGAGGTIESPVAKEPLKVVVQPDGTLLIQGDKKDVDDITDVMDVITEDLAAGEVVRIFQFKYGDVTAAAEVLTIMFDVQQRQPIVLQQPQQQQRGRQGQTGRDGDDERSQQSMFDQFRGMVGGQGQQKAAAQMRIATDPGHNYLIIKCNAADLPDIRQLLRELDIPPGEVKIQVYQLKNLDATETAENIKDVLGISKVQQRRTGGRQATAQRGGSQQQLMEMLQQQMVSVPGVEGGAKVERVEIVPNQITNSLMVSAPPEVMGVIENVISELEELGGTDVVGIHYYPLQKSRVDDIVPLLERIFEATAGGGGAGGRGGKGGGGASPAAMGSVSISGDPRTNTLIYTAENKDVTIVEAQIKALDIEGSVAEAETYICVHGDASSLAAAAEAIYGPGGGGGKRGEKGAAAGGSDVRIVAEPATNTITVWGPLDKRDLIFAKITELDQLNNQEVANIPVANVPPSQIISFIYQFLDQTSPGGGEGRGKGAVAEPDAPQIVPNDNGKTLIVRGSQRQIEEIRDLVAQFDDPDITANQVAVLPVPYGEDPDQLAATIQQIVNESEQQRAELTGGKPRQVTIAANQYTHTIIVAGDSTAFGLVRTVMDQLRDVRGINPPTTKILQVRNLSAEAAAKLINDLQQNTGSAGSSTRRSTTTPRSTTPRSTTPRSSTRRRVGGGGGGGGAFLSPAPSYEGGPAVLRPCFGLTVLTPTLTFVACQMVGDDDPPAARRERKPARDQGQTRLVRAFQPGRTLGLDDDPPPTTRPAPAKPAPDKAPRPKAAQPKSAPPKTPPVTPAEATPAPIRPAVTAPVAPPPTSQPSLTSEELAGLLSGVSGQLKGEVQAQALDSGQLIVTGDADDIAFIEQILAVMEASKSPPAIEVFGLKYAKAAVLGPIIEAVIQSEASVRGADEQFSVNVEGRSNSLIISASEVVMDRIAALVEQLDVDKAGEGSIVRMVVVNNMRAAEAVALLKPAIDKLNAIGEVPKEAQASVTAVERSNAVMIVGTQKDVEQIEKLVQDVDVELIAKDKDKDKAASFTTADVILVQLKNGSAEDVAKVLMDMIEEQQKNARNAGGEKPGDPFVKVLRLRLADGRELPDLNLDRPIKIIPEKGTNSLIIFSNKENNEALTEIVHVFDTLPVGADTDVKAFVLQHARAEDVAKLLDEVFKNKQYLTRPSDGDASKLEKGVLPPVPPGLAAQGLPYPLNVQSDARSNTVIVIGRKDAVILAGGLISELDRTSTDLGLTAHVLGPLKFMQAAQLVEKLDTLLQDRAKALGSDANEARDSAVIQPEERTNSLIVFASEDMYNLIEDLVLELDSTPKYSVVDLRYRALKYSDAQKLQGLLEEMFTAKEEAEKQSNKDAQDTLTVLADIRSNSLLLTGTRDYLDEAEGLIAKLDQQFVGTVEMRAFKIRLNSATNIATLLQDMVDKALKQQDSKLSGTEIHVSSDPISDTLLVVAAREDLDVIGRWVEILDRPSEVGRMTAIIPVRRPAEDTAKAAQDIFKFGGKQGGEVDVTITHDPGTNSVVAFGPPALVKDIEVLVRQLDGTDPLGMAEVRIFKLTQADAEMAGELLQRILEGEGGSVGGSSSSGGGSSQDVANQVMLIWQSEVGTLRALRSEIRILADVRTNSLFVTAPPEAMGLMESLIKTVDVPPDAAKIRVFRLVNADAEQMVETLKELFERESVTKTGGGGGQDETERVLQVEGMGGEGGRQEIAFTTDVRTNSVIAAGTPGYLDLVEQMILDLDTVPIQDREILVYSPKYMPAAELAPTITEFSENERQRLEDIGEDISTSVLQQRDVSAIANEESNRVVLSVDPRFKSTLMRVIDDLDRPVPQVMIQVLIIEVTVDNDLDLGVEFAFQDLQYAKAGTTDTTTFDYVGGTDIGAAGSGLGGFTFTVTGADFNFLFRTLQSEGSLKVLSRPQIIAMDNKLAKIDISDDVPYVTGTQTSTTGQISTSVGRKSVGIVLEVTPQINPDGFVSMEVKQEVSDLTDSTISVGSGVTSPVFFTRKAESNIMVKDNETVVLGGLITSRSQQREQKVPILGDIPGLGALFRYQNDSSKRTELLIVLTPRVLRTVEDYRNLSIAERDNMSLIPDEMLSDPLMQGLQLQPAESEAVEPIGRATAVPLEEPVREEPLDADTYGPIRPALQPATRPADPDSYDIPLTWKGAQRL